MKNLRLTILAILLTGTQPAGAATPTDYGVSASTLWADCSVLLCDDSSFTNLINPINVFTQSGGLQQTMASQLNVVQQHLTLFGEFLDMGRTWAQVDLDPATPGAFELGVKAESFDFDGWVGALAFSIAGFTYSGGPGFVDVNAALTGSIMNLPTLNDPNPSDAAFLSAHVSIVRDDGLIMFPNPAPSSLSELTNFVFGLPVEDFWEDSSFADTGGGTVTLSTGIDPVSIEFTQDDIDMGLTNFYVVSAAAAGATDVGRITDALGTLTTTFNTTDLIPSAVVVPLPSAIWLFGAGVAGILFIRRQATA